MELLEREQYEDTLGAALLEARNGTGRTVLIGGEAGVGKTALVEHFVAERGRSARVLWGACDALLTPRPLGPLHDIIRQAPADLGKLLDSDGDWLAVASAILAWLARGASPTVVVVEDAHWADEATLDLLRFLGRRMAQTRAMLIITYRDDELGPQHPLRRVLGDLPARATIRLTLPRLSEAAVDRLARQAGRPVEGLYAATGGNPFFVTEVLAHEAEDLPATVRDAVLGRAARLSPPARRVLDLASIVPGAIEQWLVAAVCGPPAQQIEECGKSGLLLLREDRLAFRHDLARRAVEDALPPTRARELHAQVLAALTNDGIEPAPLARLVHHAAQAGDAASVLRFAPQAARQASGAGAHCQAADHYATALRYAARLAPEDRAELLDGRSFECYLMGESDAAIQARQEATAIWRGLDRLDRAGEEVRWLSRLYWFAGNKQEADRYADEAIAILEPLGPGPALAMAYSNRAQLHGLAEEHTAALGWGRRALALAWELGETETLVHALTNIGVAELKLGDQTGHATLEMALTTALAHELHDHVGRAYANLACAAIEVRDYAQGLRYLEEGLAYVTARDLDTYGPYMRGWRARARFEQGHWQAAEEDARRALRDPPGAAVVPLPALITLGHLYARCGEPSAAALLDSARTIAIPTGEPQRLGPLAAARAEAAWWRGDAAQTLAEARTGYDRVLHTGDGWMLGQLVFWMWRAGDRAARAARLALPYELMLRGEWRAAAAEWARIGCPFEQGLALAEGDEAAQLAALEIFDQLGARPAGEALRRKLRAAGVKGIPRGARPVTRGNPFGLTGRENEVLTLLGEGLSNADIAARLSISAKTVDHHVSAILAKIGAHTRGEAVAAARRG